MRPPYPDGPPDRTPITVGEVWENPVTGERATILELPWHPELLPGCHTAPSSHATTREAWQNVLVYRAQLTVRIFLADVIFE